MLYVAGLAVVLLAGIVLFCGTMFLVRCTRASALAHLPRGVLVALLICAGVATDWARKVSSHEPARSPRSAEPPMLVAGEVSSAEAQNLFPAYTNAVTNLCFTGIHPAETSVFLRVAWPPTLAFPGDAFDVFAQTVLATNGWEVAGRVEVDAADGEAVVEVPHACLPEPASPAMFFTLGLLTDSDGDGLTDAYERLVSQTDPELADTDGDGLPDGWEDAVGLDPLSAEGDDGADGDWDRDGLSNMAEYQNDCHPRDSDTDGDGVDDATEIAQNSDPNSASDQGVAPPEDEFRELVFRVYGDYDSAWELTVAGQGPDDTRTQRIITSVPVWYVYDHNPTLSVPLKLRKGNSYRLSMRWRGCHVRYSGEYYHPYEHGAWDWVVERDECGPWYCWELGIEGGVPNSCSYRNFSHERLAGNEVLSGEGWIADNAQGLLTSRVAMSKAQPVTGGGMVSGGGNLAESLAATLYVLRDPVLIPDYDRDGKIDGADAAKAEEGVPFRFWLNDDNDSGDVNVGADDQPGSGPNYADDHVNGRCDLLDFTPVLIDMSGVFPPDTPQMVRDRVEWRLWSSVVNAVWTSLAASEAGRFQRADCGARFGQNLSQRAHEAAVTSLSVSTTLPEAFVRHMEANGGKGVVLLEGSFPVMLPLRLSGRPAGMVPTAVETSLDLHISYVENMYRWACLRYVCGDASGLGDRLGDPFNWPDAERDGRHFVFVHGYNVDAQSVRAWASEMFRRLWQSGSNSRFTAVDWCGDDSQITVPVVGEVSPNYYVNVEHAFMTASALKDVCDQLSGEKVMLAHSLGNMLVSAAAKDFNLQYSKYYMLNAAVPMEAYDNDASDNLMVDGAWKDIGSRYRASCFYELFSQTPSDFRSKLSWKGRFAGIPNAVNCYSPTEDILENPSVLKVLGMTVGETTGGFWAKQELFKGCEVWYGINSVTFAGTRIEGGWGINANYMANPLAYIPLVGFNASYFANYTRDDLITNPLFTSFNDSRMASTNALNITDYALRAKMLGDAIPAESFAAGRNMIGGVSGNYNYQSATPNGWPSNRDGWFHSDLKDVAFWYTYKLFEKIVKGE